MVRYQRHPSCRRALRPEAMLECSQDERMTPLLIGLQGFHWEEAARILALPLGTVHARLSRVRKRVRAMHHDHRHQ
jgi:DNA-directed RNA polymerase specialized sigma24 family protein